MINLSKDRDKKLTFKLFKIKRPRGVEQEHSLKKNDKNHKKVIVCNYQYVRS